MIVIMVIVVMMIAEMMIVTMMIVRMMIVVVGIVAMMEGWCGLQLQWCKQSGRSRAVQLNFTKV